MQRLHETAWDARHHMTPQDAALLSEAAAEIEHLQKMHALGWSCQKCPVCNSDMAGPYVELQKDAERYRWLRDLPELCLGVAGIPCIAIPDGPRSGTFVSYADCDEAIDRAIDAERQA